MALSKQDFEEIRKEIDTCKRPIFFFHDDPDGLASFLLLYRYCRKGCGVVVKSAKLDNKFLKKVGEYLPDKIFVLDIAVLEPSFYNEVHVPIVWVDHHQPLQVPGIKYFNPRMNNPDDNQPVSYLCYKVTKKDLWIAMTGCIGDWFLPDFSNEFSKKYPDLLPEISSADEARFNSRIGELVSVFSFVLKGQTKDVLQCVKVLTRVKTPYEILDKETSQGNFIFRKYFRINEKYQNLLKQALSKKQMDEFFTFIYKHDQMSFTQDMANEILYRTPNKLIIIGREKSDEIKLSIRSREIKLPPLVKKALEDLEGYGGGHEFACGVNVKRRDFKMFIKKLKECFAD